MRFTVRGVIQTVKRWSSVITRIYHTPLSQSESMTRKWIIKLNQGESGSIQGSELLYKHYKMLLKHLNMLFIFSCNNLK